MGKVSKKIKKKKQHQKREYQKYLCLCLVLLITVVSLNIVIAKSNLLEPKINEVTASYISFNNQNTTDMLRINNIKRLSDEKGKSTINKKSVEFTISGEKNKEYDIIIYPLKNEIDKKYIMFSVEDKKGITQNSLSSMPVSNDDGIIIVQGAIKESNKKILRMWISKEYKDKITNTSFEIKVKPR